MDLSKWVNKTICVFFRMRDDRSFGELKVYQYIVTLKSFSNDSLTVLDGNKNEGIIPYSAVLMITEVPNDKVDNNAPESQ